MEQRFIVVIDGAAFELMSKADAEDLKRRLAEKGHDSRVLVLMPVSDAP